MLSGLTNQLGGLMSSVKSATGGNKEEGAAAGATPEGGGEQPAATDNAEAAATVTKSSRSGSASEEQKDKAPGGGVGAGAANMLSGVRSSLPSWLGGGGNNANKEEPGSTLPPPTVENKAVTPEEENKSDASSATGDADSEKERQKANTEADAEAAAAGGETNLEKVKTLGSFLFSTIKGAGQKIKDTAKGGGSVSPWVGHPKETELKEEILGLSTDRRNFVRSPPTGVSFEWNYDEMLPVAKAILKDDPNLEKMRFELVPKVVSEENFWRNYFYRVMLLKESLSQETKKQDSIDTDEEDAELEKELNEELKEFEVVDRNKQEDKELDSLLDLK